MDAISQKKIDILRAFASLVDSGADVAPYVSSMYRCTDALDNNECSSVTFGLLAHSCKQTKLDRDDSLHLNGT
jgi:hypothetical protein